MRKGGSFTRAHVLSSENTQKKRNESKENTTTAKKWVKEKREGELNNSFEGPASKQASLRSRGISSHSL